MKMKVLARRVVDTAMAAAMVVLMARGIMGDAAHEIVGIGAFGLFLAHHLLNTGWQRALFRKARFDEGSVVDCLLYAAMIGTAVSSVLVSKEAFAFAGIEGGLLARRLHACVTAWCFILASVHMGLHLNVAGYRSSLGAAAARPGMRAWPRTAAVSAMAAYGAYCIFAHGLPERLVMYYAYSFWPSEKNWLLLVDMAAIMCFFACAAELSTSLSRRDLKMNPRTLPVRSTKE
jgi:hypothetical protein